MAFVKDNLMKCSINEACQMVTDLAKEYAKNEVDLFCRIMGYPKNEHNDFIGGDPHGVVAIQEDYMFFNMSDIHVVLKEYERWLKIYGDNKGIRKAVEQWYYWSLDWHQKHPRMEWIDATKHTPPMIEKRSFSEEVLVSTNYGNLEMTVYSDGAKMWYLNTSREDEDAAYWAKITKPDDTYCPNLRSWLAGCPVPGLRDATLEWQTQREKDLQAAHQRVEECKQALEDAIKEEVKLNKF